MSPGSRVLLGLGWALVALMALVCVDAILSWPATSLAGVW